MTSNWPYRILAVILAIIAWYLLSGLEKVEVWVEVPVQIRGMPADKVILGGMVNKVDVRMRGPKGAMSGSRGILSGSEFGSAYTVDLAGLEKGENVIPLTQDGIDLPRNVEVMEISPNRMLLNVDLVAEKTVPVKARWSGEVDPDYTLNGWSTTPAAVTLRGPASVLEKLEEARATSVPLDSTRPGLVRRTVELDLPAGVVSDPQRVEANLVFGVKTTIKNFLVSVSVPAPEGVTDVRVKPDRVRLRVEVPLPLSREKELGTRFTAEAVPGEEGFAPDSKYEVPFRVRLPEGCTLVETKPDKVTVHLGKAVVVQE